MGKIVAIAHTTFKLFTGAEQNLKLVLHFYCISHRLFPTFFARTQKGGKSAISQEARQEYKTIFSRVNVNTFRIYLLT